MKNNFSARLIAASMAASAALVACGGGGAAAVPGKAAIFLKDAPITTSDNRPADQVNIEILKIELQRANGEEITVFSAEPGAGISGNVLALTAPILLSTVSIPTGDYSQINLLINATNATIHFTDNNVTSPLIVKQEGEQTGELEFEFQPPFAIEATGVSNAVIDFAPIVTRDANNNYVLGHDHANDQTEEENQVGGGNNDNTDDPEVEGDYVSTSGDVLTLKLDGGQVQVDISTATTFTLNDATVTKDQFKAGLTAGMQVEAKGTFSNGVLTAGSASADSE